VRSEWRAFAVVCVCYRGVYMREIEVCVSARWKGE